MRSLAKNEVFTSLIGMGYSDTVTPPVILRNVLENPAWYTAYTPYQPEISQGRLEALLNFQTMVSDLTAMDLAERVAARRGERRRPRRMAICQRLNPKGGDTFFVDADCHPQTIEVVRTRAEPIGIDVVVGDPDARPARAPGCSACSCSTRGAAAPCVTTAGSSSGCTSRTRSSPSPPTCSPSCCSHRRGRWAPTSSSARAQRFGVPLGYGGPHAAFMAVRDAHKRSLPGRLVGVSVDAAGRPALRLALQTREQHIRREKATSNICTAQVLLAVIAGLYATYHGPDGLRSIASRVHRLTAILAAGLRGAGVEVAHDAFFDTLTVRVPGPGRGDRGRGPRPAAEPSRRRRRHARHLARRDDDARDRGRGLGRVRDRGVGRAARRDRGRRDSRRAAPDVGVLDASGVPTYHSETEMLRYLRRLADRDLALDRTMIPLGSCTMKLNATAEMIPITWPEFGGIHPFAPVEQARGYLELFADLERWLCEVTGYDAVSSAAQRRVAGRARRSARHPRVPRGARRVGSRRLPDPRVGARDERGQCVDGGHARRGGQVRRRRQRRLRRPEGEGARARRRARRPRWSRTRRPTACSRRTIREVCALVHEYGGQVYLDGANLNALVGVAKPGEFGADVSHLNLHKTFCIPHGGGGPGRRAGRGAVAPRAVPAEPPAASRSGSGDGRRADLGRAVGLGGDPADLVGLRDDDGRRRASPGPRRSRSSTRTTSRGGSTSTIPVLYIGPGGLVAHECILDLRPITSATGVTAEDVAKRLIDYGFHAPTMSFPVAGTLMVEPTESESKRELDRFCDAMIAIRGEIARVEAGEWTVDDSPLRHAPHPAADVAVDEWARAYSREVAAFPVASLRADKYWPPVGRIDGVYGDRNVMCSCPPIEAYSDEPAHG